MIQHGLPFSFCVVFFHETFVFSLHKVCFDVQSCCEWIPSCKKVLCTIARFFPFVRLCFKCATLFSPDVKAFWCFWKSQLIYFIFLCQLSDKTWLRKDEMFSYVNVFYIKCHLVFAAEISGVGKNCEAGESRRNFSNCIGREQWTCGLNGSIFLSTYPGRQLLRNAVPTQRIIKKVN